MASAVFRRPALALLFALALLPGAALALPWPAYEDAAFKAAQEAGGPILVWVHAEW